MGILQACGYLPLYTHDPLCQCKDFSDVNLLMIKRRDIFATVMSNCIAWKTGQTVDYQKKEIDPFEVDSEKFLSQWCAAEMYQSYHDLSRSYKRVEEFVYEDIIQDYSIVIDRLGLELKTDFSEIQNLNNAAPYNYKEVIKNWQELRKLFETVDISTIPNVYTGHHGKRYADFELNNITWI